ncbi:MAG TPA: alpha-D-ribose 1-methylphosphonate 5-triphosphate diphosphatase [Xanthobacteraceae bacterium]
MSELIITNAQIVTRHEVVRGNLVVRDQRICTIDQATRPSAAAGAVDFSGDYLLPGLVELHTDNLEHAATPRPAVRWPALSAVVTHDAQMAASGITTVFDAIAVGDVQRGGDRLSRLDTMVEAVKAAQDGGMLRAEHRLHLRCELSYHRLKEIMAKLADHPLIGLMSLMDHTPGQRQFVTMEQYKVYYQCKYQLSDTELANFVAERMRDQKLYAQPNREAVIALARTRAVKLASHDDATPAHVAEAAAAGVVIAEFPTTLAAAQAARAAGMHIVGGAPNVVRGSSHSGNASARDLARSGLLDILSSDYVPVALLQAAFTLNDELAIGLPAAIATVSANPAEAVGLSDRGMLACGLRGDLVRVALHDGLPVVRATWRGGERVA